tara:strand:- start:278 stop:520 length:243 start_codon:yes stop_codon:yes gene_type:complete
MYLWGSCHDLTNVCGYGDIGEVVRDINVNLILVLFPLTSTLISEMDEIRRQGADKDDKVDMQDLPKSLVIFDMIQIEFLQ